MPVSSGFPRGRKFIQFSAEKMTSRAAAASSGRAV
jgi:hypothetical protein